MSRFIVGGGFLQCKSVWTCTQVPTFRRNQHHLRRESPKPRQAAVTAPFIVGCRYKSRHLIILKIGMPVIFKGTWLLHWISLNLHHIHRKTFQTEAVIFFLPHLYNQSFLRNVYLSFKKSKGAFGTNKFKIKFRQTKFWRSDKFNQNLQILGLIVRQTKPHKLHLRVLCALYKEHVISRDSLSHTTWKDIAYNPDVNSF